MVTFQIPTGVKNIKDLFPGVNFNSVAEYYLELKDKEDNSVVVTTTRYKLGCCCNSDKVRVFFVNYLGGIDGVNFQKISITDEVQSERWKKPLQSPHAKWDGGIQRFNVTANESVVLETTCYSEKDMDWLKELFETPNAWIQWSGTQGQDDDYIPIVIRDGSFETRKREGRYQYVVTIVFDYANENQILRN